ncbi:MAG: LamB/YcsF family protein [Syntrophorhabdus sp.]|nr:LamB/YcsF family protein [Syntrophorhabdus sp.]
MRGVFDLNCDVGESFGAWVMGNDAEVMRHVTSANIACGVHASDPGVMRRTAWLCKQYGVMAGAHPGYPDLQGFGRRRMDMERGEIIDWVIYQVGALRGFTSLAGIPLRHVKLHGALYNRVSQEEELLLDIAGAVRGAFGDVVFVTLASPASGELKQRFRSSGVRVALEAFPDRAYTEEGALVARGHEGAVIKDARIIASRAIGMVREGCIESVNGRRIACEIDTLCIHGDNKESALAAPLIREYAAREGIAVRPLVSFV